jgi:putative acetyltransferase
VGRDEIHIREYRASDVDILIELFRNSVRNVARHDYTHEQVLAWAPDNIDCEPWAKKYENRQAWIAQVDGVPAGFSDLEPDGHLDMMFVHADYQRIGVASALLCKVETVAKERGLSRLYSEVSITARPFFELRGFRVIAAQTVTKSGQEFLNYRMEKAINSK